MHGWEGSCGQLSTSSAPIAGKCSAESLLGLPSPSYILGPAEFRNSCARWRVACASCFSRSAAALAAAFVAALAAAAAALSWPPPRCFLRGGGVGS